MSAVAFFTAAPVYMCNELEYHGEKKYFRHCSLQFSCWHHTHSLTLPEKFRGEWERLREMFYIFYKQSFPRVLRKAVGALKSLIHCVGYRDSPGIQIAISLTTDTVESRFRDIGKHWHEFSRITKLLLFMFSYICVKSSSRDPL